MAISSIDTPDKVMNWRESYYLKSALCPFGYRKTASKRRWTKTAKTGQFRLYTADDVIRLNFIKQMQCLGFSLQQIRQLLELRDRGRYDCGEVSNLLNEKLGEIRGKIRELQKLKSEMAIDWRKCNRDLKERQSRAPRQCPLLTDLKEAK